MKDLNLILLRYFDKPRRSLVREFPKDSSHVRSAVNSVMKLYTKLLEREWMGREVIIKTVVEFSPEENCVFCILCCTSIL